MMIVAANLQHILRAPRLHPAFLPANGIRACVCLRISLVARAHVRDICAEVETPSIFAQHKAVCRAVDQEEENLVVKMVVIVVAAVPLEEAPQEEALEGVILQVGILQGVVAQVEALQEVVAQVEVVQEEAPQEEALQGVVLQVGILQGVVAQVEALQEVVAQVEVVQEEDHQVEALQGEALQEVVALDHHVVFVLLHVEMAASLSSSAASSLLHPVLVPATRALTFATLLLLLPAVPPTGIHGCVVTHPKENPVAMILQVILTNVSEEEVPAHRGVPGLPGVQDRRGVQVLPAAPDRQAPPQAPEVLDYQGHLRAQEVLGLLVPLHLHQGIHHPYALLPYYCPIAPVMYCLQELLVLRI